VDVVDGETKENSSWIPNKAVVGTQQAEMKVAKDIGNNKENGSIVGATN
jgi:hypothetical protein